MVLGRARRPCRADANTAHWDSSPYLSNGYNIPENALVRDYVDQAEIGKTASCHRFHHTCATLKLEGGAATLRGSRMIHS